MTTAHMIREVLGWCVILNFSLMAFSMLTILLAQEPIKRIHRRLFGLSHDDLSRAYFQYLAQFKSMAIVFTLVPCLALSIVTR